MSEEEISKIEEIILEGYLSGGGPLDHKETKMGEIKLDNISSENISVCLPQKKDCVVYIKYFEDEKRYGFSVYEKGDRK